MKNKLILGLLAFAVAAFTFSSCEKECDGCPDAVGGQLLTHYIIIKDSAFSPSSITAVNGSSFTFVNNTGAVKGVYSMDSIIINKPSIPTTSSFFFKKDTVGTIYYHMAGKPSVVGSITLTP